VNTGAVLGIDTSCYTTSCAMVSKEHEVLASVRLPLKVDRGERGLRQSEAVFQHVRQLPLVLEQALGRANRPAILAVCASGAPTDREASYMPVFTTGLSYAQGIAQALGVPCFSTSHQLGHFAAAGIGLKALPAAHLGMHLSGGTTETVLIKESQSRLINATRDISAGQLIDRIGVAMGLSFPAGEALEKLVQACEARGRYPAVFKEDAVSFSGVEAAALRDLAAGMPGPMIAAELFDCIARAALKMGLAAYEATGVDTLLITGGVASSALLRRLMKSRCLKRGLPLRLHFGQQQYAGDNAAGVAVIGLEKLNQALEV